LFRIKIYDESFVGEGRDDGDNDSYMEHSSWKASSPSADSFATRNFKTSR